VKVYQMNISDTNKFANNNTMESLIKNVQVRISFGQTSHDIALAFEGKFTPDDIFLAYHAAKILDKR